MSSEDKKYILSLDVALDENIKKVVEDSNFEFVKSIEDVDIDDIQIIMASDLASLESAFEEYDLLEKGVKSVLTSNTEELERFSSLNGEFIFGEFGHIVQYNLFANYLNEFLTIHLLDREGETPDDLYTFNVIKLSSIGLYLDEVGLFFEKHGFPAYRARFFIDYIIYYLFSLRNIGQVDVPLSIDISKSGGLIHFNINAAISNIESDAFWRHFIGDDQKTSHFKNSLYLADFLEITYLEVPEKINIYAAWEEGELFGNNFSLRTIERSLSEAKVYEAEAEHLILGSQLEEKGNLEEITDISDDELGAILEEEGLSLDELDDAFSDDDFNEDDESINVTGEGEEDDSSARVGGADEDEEGSSLVKGSDEDDEASLKLSESNEKKAELIQKVSSLESNEDFITSISTSFKDEIKKEIMRVAQSTDSGESKGLDILKVLENVTDRAEEKGILKSGGREHLRSLIENKELDKVLSLLSLDAAEQSSFATFLDGSSDEDKQMIQRLGDEAKEKELLLKKAGFDQRLMKEKYELDIKRLQAQIKSKDQQLLSVQKNYAEKTVASQNEITRLKELIASGAGSEAALLGVKKFSSGSEDDGASSAELNKVKRELDLARKQEKMKSREMVQLRKQVGKLTTKLKEQTIKQSKRGGMSMREKVLEGNLKKAQAGFAKLKKENTVLKQKLLTATRNKK